MSKWRHKKRTSLPRSVPFTVVAIVVAILGFTQIERFTSKGTVLGYQLRKVGSIRQISDQEKKENPAQTNEACKRVSEKFVSDLLNQPVMQGAFSSDRITPELFSSCIFRTKKGASRTVSMTYRERQTEDIAKNTTNGAAKRGARVTVTNSNEAYFSEDNNQLTARRGQIIAVVTVSKASQDQPSSKDAAVKIAAELLK